MAKLISVSNEVYETLTKLKGENSYSETIKVLFAQKSNKQKLLSFFGRGGIDDKRMKQGEAVWKAWSKECA